MPALRRRNVLAKLMKMVGASRSVKISMAGPGCTCESCVQAWDRVQPARAVHEGGRRLRLGLY